MELILYNQNNQYGEEVLTNFLKIQGQILRYHFKKNPKQLNKNIKNCAVIVEPRSEHNLLEEVCRNVMYFLPQDWDLVVFSYDRNIVSKKLENIEHIFYSTDKNSFTIEEYNNLLTSKDFWEKIPSENIIIFQTDSYITRRFSDTYIESIVKYPFVGAVYRFGVIEDICSLCPNDSNFMINGGFSFRKKSAMIDCINKITLGEIINFRIKKNLLIHKELAHEDVYFQHALYLLGYSLPDYNTCILFCSQTSYELVDSYAVHGINKSYVYKNFILHIRPSILEISKEILKNELIN